MPTATGARYLEYALATVAYVKGKVRFGAANRPKDHATLPSQLRAFGALDRVRRGADKDAVARFVNPNDAWRNAQVWAENVEKYGGGNCGEQSALALVHLRKFGAGAYPITWVYFTNRDHAFVMLGWPNPDGWELSMGWLPKNPQPWLQDAVVCDPWANRACYWTEVPNEYNRAFLGRNFHRDAESQMTVWINK